MKLQKTFSLIILASALAFFSFPAMAEQKNDVVFTLSVSEESFEEVVSFETDIDSVSEQGVAQVFHTPLLLVDWETDISIEMNGRELIRKSRI